MARKCAFTGKKTKSGHNVSHSNRKTKRTFVPNLQLKSFIDPETGEKFYARISMHALRILTKNPRKMLEFARSERKKFLNRENRLFKRFIKNA